MRCKALRIEWIPNQVVHNAKEAEALFEKFDKLGYEGMMLRDETVEYKIGRSTKREQILLKMKKRIEGIATVKEVMPEKDKHGEIKRNLDGSTRLGAFLCDFVVPPQKKGDVEKVVTVKVGTGFTAQDRIDMASTPAGTKIEIYFQELSEKGVPRFPVFHRIVGDYTR